MMNWSLLANSISVAGAATLVALLLGFAGAVILSTSGGVARKLLFAFTIAVLALPAFLVVNCWIDLLGTNGVLRRWLPLNVFSVGGAGGILALMLWPIPALAIWSGWQKLQPVYFEIDPALRGPRLFRFLLLPAAKQQIGWSAIIVFALALNNFAVPTILQVKVFTSEAWVRFNTNLDPVGALLLSWPVILAPLALLLFLRQTLFSWPRETLADNASLLRNRLGRRLRIPIGFLCGLALACSLFAPLAQLALAPRTWHEFAPAFIAGRAALINSVTYATFAAALALTLALPLARVRGLNWSWLLFFLPGVLLGIAAVTALNRPVFDFFARTAAIVIALLVIRYFPLARAVSRDALQSVDRELIDSGRLDGARGFTLFRRIVFPQISSQIAAALYIVYVLCLWDVETILLVIPPGGETLALRIFNFLHYGHNAHVNALCLLLLTLALAPLALFGGWKAVRRT